MLAAFLQAADADGPQLHNTTSPAHVRGGQAHDVIPARSRSTSMICALFALDRRALGTMRDLIPADRDGAVAVVPYARM